MTETRIRPLSLATIQLMVAGVIGVVYYSFGTMQQALSAAAGGLFMWVNWLFLSWSWWRILSKKSFALGGSVIVLKYAILGIALIALVRQPWLEIVPLVLGIGGVIPTVLIYAFLHRTGS